MKRVDFDVDFFYGENEELLLKTTLNDIQIEELPKLERALQSYLDANAVNTVITSISLDGCDDASIHLKGREPVEICSETTFEDMLIAIAPGLWGA